MSNVGYPWGSNLTNISSSDSATLNFTQATDGDTYGTYIRMGKGNRYNAGTITITASNIKVQDRESHIIQDYGTYIGSVYVGSSSNKQNLQNNGSVSFNVNYYMGSGTENDVDIVFTSSLNNDYVMDGTITAYWSGVSQDCNYSFKTNSLQFNGASQTVLNSYDTTHLLVSGQNATNAGTYTCTLTVKDQYKAMWCLRNDEGEMTDSISKKWSIEKVTPEFTIENETININSGAAAQIKGVFPGYSKYTISDSSVVEVLGYDDRDGVPKLRLKGVAEGTCNITVYSTATTNYYSNNYTFSVTVEDNRDAQNWYYENTSVTVGNTAYIYRQYQSGGNKVSTKTPSCTVGNSSVISATVYNDGRIAIKGKQIGTSSLTVSIDEDDNYKYKSDIITVTVTGKKEQYWKFDSPINLKTGETITVSPTEGTLYGTVSIGVTEEDKKLFKDIKFNTDTQILTIIANDSISGSTTINVVANGGDEYSPWDQDITINVTKEDVNWEFNSPISIEQGKSATVTPTKGKITGSVKFGYIQGEAELLFNDVSFNNSTQELKIETKSTGSGSTTLKVIEVDPKDITHVLHEQEIIVNVTEEQQWKFVGSVDIELDKTAVLKPLTGTLYGKVTYGYPTGDKKYFKNIEFDSTKQELTISANATYSGNTTLTIIAQGDATHGYKEQDIIVNIIKHKQAWELRPSEISIPVGGSSTVRIAGDIPLGGTLTPPTYSSQYIDVVSHTVAGTNPYYTITGKQAVSRTILTISNIKVPTYDDLSKEAYIAVRKKEQTWDTAHEREITIEPYANYNISIFGTVYGGIDYTTESSIINISDKSENGCKITSNGTTGIATVTISSPGNEEYNDKTISVKVTVIKNLQWIQINPHIYKNGKWIEMSPKIYKNGKWLSGIIKKYISKGDIYGK